MKNIFKLVAVLTIAIFSNNCLSGEYLNGLYLNPKLTNVQNKSSLLEIKRYSNFQMYQAESEPTVNSDSNCIFNATYEDRKNIKYNFGTENITSYRFNPQDPHIALVVTGHSKLYIFDAHKDKLIYQKNLNYVHTIQWSQDGTSIKLITENKHTTDNNRFFKQILQVFSDTEKAPRIDTKSEKRNNNLENKLKKAKSNKNFWWKVGAISVVAIAGIALFCLRKK